MYLPATGEKVGFGKVCLWCNEKGKSFYSTEAVQAHMNNKSHCKLYTDGDAALEFADFYDFRYVGFACAVEATAGFDQSESLITVKIAGGYAA